MENAVKPRPILVLGKMQRLLDAFTPEAPQLTVSQLREATGLPATTCIRLVQNLTDQGLLDRQGSHYRVGATVLRWSVAALSGLDVVTDLRPIIDALRDRTGESAAIYTRRGLERTCLAVAPTRHAVIWQLHVGMTTPLYVGSGGRALLAFDPAAEKDVLATERHAFTAHTLVDHRTLQRALARTRTTLVAQSRQELDEDVAGVSSPVFGPNGQVVAAIGVAGPAHRFKPAQMAGYARAVLDAARHASLVMGGDFPGRKT